MNRTIFVLVCLILLSVASLQVSAWGYNSYQRPYYSYDYNYGYPYRMHYSAGYYQYQRYDQYQSRLYAGYDRYYFMRYPLWQEWRGLW